jgi:uncharacterized protein (DUF1778 family)
MSAVAKKKETRLEARCLGHQKELLVQASEILGQSISEFVLSTTLKRARKIVSEAERLTLSNRDRDAFLQSIDASNEPNLALKVAFKSWKKATS